MVTLHLKQPDDPDEFLRVLKHALTLKLDPSDVIWDDGQAQASLLDDGAASPLTSEVDGAQILLPRGFLTLVRSSALHDDPDRYVLMHTAAVNILRDRSAWSDALNPVRLRLERMAREVHREIHKMHAFVRFRVVKDEAGECHVAWFEPAHHIVRAATPFFVDRFAAMRWSILTPRGCVQWDRHSLIHGPAASPAEAPQADDGEALWLAYYRSIFNPARIKMNMMRREMPVRFWKNLPEATQVTSMLQAAGEREFRMRHVTDGPRHRKAARASSPLPPVERKP
ncbi:TIGR03915 family putative DNA repair protein [Ottowia thiooxydans]|uniref:TIGR03915 family putative DNA repair protein n=1 Tax=Ottowia thiooxydans TaxID=219182 RepID=UPI00040A7911|nr:TIGR03915 family putative DNA repair protein [Ottowia thiooxydans]